MKPKPKTKRRINYRLLRRSKSEILKEPRRFNMNEGVLMDDKIAPCGTTACLAGTAVICSIQTLKRLDWKRAALTLPKAEAWTGQCVARWGSIYSRARKLLGLSVDQADRLFYDYHWPSAFRYDHYESKTRQAKAEVAARRIDFFIKTKGTDRE